MTRDWFDGIEEKLRRRLDAATPGRTECVAGVRVNGAPHIGTYLTLASAFAFAVRSAEHLNLPAGVRIHFLDNDPATAGMKQHATHFHSVFQKRTSEESHEFIRSNYLLFLDDLSALTGRSYNWELYSTSQTRPEFRSAVLHSLRDWKDFKYYVSGPPWVEAPTGVRGIGCPCPECGLFNGQFRPSVDLLTDETAVLTSECCDHGEYSATLTRFNDAFLNLETTYRNVVKEMLALKDKECLSIIIKGLDWKEGIRNVDFVLGILGISKEAIPLRFLVPLIKTENGAKFSKSAILAAPEDFKALPSFLLDMNVFRLEVRDYAHKLLTMAEQVLSDPAFASRHVLPRDILRMLGVPA